MTLSRGFSAGQLFCCILTVLFSWPVPSRALDPEEFKIDIWTQDQGVPRDFVTRFSQGEDGFLWMVSDQTLARFDGVRFVEIGLEKLLPSLDEIPATFRPPLRLHSTESHTVWLERTGGGLWKWTGRQFRPWPSAQNSLDAVAKIFEPKRGQVLIITESGQLWREENNRELPMVPLKSLIPETLCRDGHGRLWFLTQEKIPACWDAKNGLQLFQDERTPSGQATSLAADSEGRLFLATTSGLFLWKTSKFEAVPNPPGLSNFPVQTILPGPEGLLWVSSDKKAWLRTKGNWKGPLADWPPLLQFEWQSVDSLGRLWLSLDGPNLWCIDPSGDVVRLTRENGLTGLVGGLFCDREGSLWITIYRVGIGRIRTRRITPVPPPMPQGASPLWTLVEDGSGAVWFSPEYKPPIRWQPSGQEMFEVPPRTRDYGWAQALSTDRFGNTWAAVWGQGLLRFEKDHFEKVIPWPNAKGYCLTFFQDQNLKWWLGTSLGLHSWEENHWKSWGKAEGLPRSATRAITEDNEGRLWIGLVQGGIARRDGNQFTLLGKAQGIPEDSVYTLCALHDGSLMIGTSGGLIRHQNKRFTHITKDHGLPDNSVVQLVEDSLGYLWIGTRNGLCRVALSSLNAVDQGEKILKDCVSFDQSDGLPTAVFQGRCFPACGKTRDGRLWFLTAGGAVYCRPEKMFLNTSAPPVIIEGITLNNKSWLENDSSDHSPADSLSKVSLNIPANLEVPPGPQLIEIHYTAPSLVAPEKVRFQHKMEGLDQDWVNSGNRRSAVYSFLPLGKFQFRVRACNNDGLWNEAGASLNLTVHPHFWQTLWFQSLAGLALAGAVAGTVGLVLRSRNRRRLDRLELQGARDAERARISRDLHDNLGAILTQISLTSQFGEKKSAAEPGATQLFQEITDTTKEGIQAMDEIVWAINPEKDRLDSLVTYLTFFVQEFFRASTIQVRLHVPADLPPIPLTAEMRHHVLLALKEACANAARHSGCTEIALHITKGEHHLKICLSDNGCGIPPGASFAGGNGLNNLQRRIAQIGGTLVITSNPNQGTRISFEIPLEPSTLRNV